MTKHPEARQALHKAAAEERLEASTPDSWRWPYGYRIRLFARDGTWRDRYTRARATYAEAKAELLSELCHPMFESATLLRLEAEHP